MHHGKALAELIKEGDIQVKKISIDLGLTTQTIYNYRKTKLFTQTILGNILKASGVSVERFMELADRYDNKESEIRVLEKIRDIYEKAGRMDLYGDHSMAVIQELKNRINGLELKMEKMRTDMAEFKLQLLKKD